MEVLLVRYPRSPPICPWLGPSRRLVGSDPAPLTESRPEDTPGVLKVLLYCVTEAKKAAEANLIARREETATMRSKADTARMLADNPNGVLGTTSNFDSRRRAQALRGCSQKYRLL